MALAENVSAEATKIAAIPELASTLSITVQSVP